MKIINAATNRNCIKRAIVCEWSFKCPGFHSRSSLKKMTDVQRKQPAFIEFSHSLYLHPIAIFSSWNKFRHKCWNTHNRNHVQWVLRQQKRGDTLSKYFQISKYRSSWVSVALRKVGQKSNHSIVISVSEFVVSIFAFLKHNYFLLEITLCESR